MQTHKEQRTIKQTKNGSNTETTLILCGYSRERANIENFSDKEKRIVLALAVCVGVETVMGNHYFEFNNKIYRHSKQDALGWILLVNWLHYVCLDRIKNLLENAK